MMRSPVVIALSLWSLSLCGAVRAEPRSARAHLEWHVPRASGCIPARELVAEVEALLARKVFTLPAQAHYALAGSVERRGQDWAAVLRLSTQTGETHGVREITAAGECAALNRPLVIVIATMLDTTEDDEMLPKAPARSIVSVGALLAGALGTLPQPALGAVLFSELTPMAAWPSARFAFKGWLPDRELSAGVGARFYAVQAELALCLPLFAGAQWRIGACAGLELGVLHARALGIDSPRSPSRMLGAIPLETNVSVHITERVALHIGINLSFAMLRPSFYFQDETAMRRVVYRPDAWGTAAQFGFIADAF